MSRDRDQPSGLGSAGDRVTFVENEIQHTFQQEGARQPAGPEDLFLRLNFVGVYVKDQERSKRFFLDQLGFQLMIDIRFPSGYRWIEVAPPDGSARLALMLPAPGFAEEALPGRSSLINFMTEDVDAKYREWSKRGVKFTLPPHAPEWGGRFCSFVDIDGNPFGLAGFNEVTRAIETRRVDEARRREAERLTAQELEIAKQVQARLLPQRAPVFPTLDCAGTCVQARAVGGDYYDFLELGENRVALIVSDIAGKGIAASLLMANLQAALRSQCAWAGDHPEQVLALVNHILFENSAPNAYATLFYAEYNMKSGRLRYSNCGHLPGLLLHGGEVEKLQSTNTMIGLFEEWGCTVAEALMRNGDILVLYTDGVTEAFSDSGNEFGEARLIETLLASRDLSAHMLVEAIVKQVENFSGDQQYDDITVVVAKKNV